jgi:hypothetical protein
MIIKSKDFKVNFSNCMKNAEQYYLKEDALNCIARQAPELIKSLPTNIEQWLGKERLQELVSSLDNKAEQQARLKTSSVMKAVKVESTRVYASFDCFFNQYIELGYSDSIALFEEVDFEYLIKLLKNRSVGFETNIHEKDTAHAALLQLSLNKQPKIFIANELGLGNMQ